MPAAKVANNNRVESISLKLCQRTYEHSMGLFNDITGAEFGVSVTGGY